jgi:hypothetical protein
MDPQSKCSDFFGEVCSIPPLFKMKYAFNLVDANVIRGNVEHFFA